jgi:hypothetical protein
MVIIIIIIIVEQRNVLLMNSEATPFTPPSPVTITATQILTRDTHTSAGQVPHFELHQQVPELAAGMPFSLLLTAYSEVQGTSLKARLQALAIYEI